MRVQSIIIDNEMNRAAKLLTLQCLCRYYDEDDEDRVDEPSDDGAYRYAVGAVRSELHRQGFDGVDLRLETAIAVAQRTAARAIRNRNEQFETFSE